MNELESIDVIKQMIDNSKRNLKSQSPFYLLWGWLILIGSIGNLLLLEVFESPYHFMVWPIVIGIGVISSFVMGVKMGKKEKTVTFIDRAMGYLWSGWLIFFFILLAIGSINNWKWGTIYSLIIGLYGLGTFISGGIIKFKPLIIGGVMSFVIALLCSVTGVDENFSLMLVALAVSIVVSYLVPGYLLRKSE